MLHHKPPGGHPPAAGQGREHGSTTNELVVAPVAARPMEHDQPPIIARTAVGGAVALSREERARHVYLVGKSGSGKSTTLFNLAMHDIMAGEGVAVIDPHGDLGEAILDAMPPERTHDVCYLNVADTQFPVGFNPLAGITDEQQALAAAGIVSAFKHLWRDSWGPRLEHFLFNGLAALLATRSPTLMDLPRLYYDDGFREKTVRRVTDPMVARFWRDEFASYDQRFRAEAAAPILNKVGQIAASPVLRNILGQTSPKFDLAYAMNHRKILIANLAKGQVGEQASNLLGSLLVSHLQLVAMARSALAPDNRVRFAIHIDEFQSFSTDAFSSLLSESRKFGAHFTLANQYLEQVPDGVRAAVLGNAGTLLTFRVSANDADILAPEFHPLPAHELADQRPYRAWIRRVDGDCRPVFLEPALFPSRERSAAVVAQSRRNFGRRDRIVNRSIQ